MRTEDGGVAVTVCYDKVGTDESLKLAQNWVAENAPDFGSDPPSISEGPVFLHVS